MKTILLKILPFDIVDYIYSIYLNEYIEYKLFGKMFHLKMWQVLSLQNLTAKCQILYMLMIILLSTIY